MKKGKKEQVNWAKYQIDDFKFPKQVYSMECGAYALHAITRQPKELILPLSDKGHWSNATMFRFLRKHGYQIIPITIGNLVEAYSVHSAFDKRKLSDKNVILVEQLCYKEENTWAVIHKNKIAHSGSVKKLNPLEFINWPIEAAYLVYHPSWRSVENLYSQYY